MSECGPCKICEKAWPPKDYYIGDLVLTKAYLFEDQFFAGWTVLILKDHRTELFGMTREERAGLMEEINQMGEALTKIFDVGKINSELLGNQVPHIHWHVIPRLITDPDPLSPVWCVPHEPVSLTASLLFEGLHLLRSALGMPSAPLGLSYHSVWERQEKIISIKRGRVRHNFRLPGLKFDIKN